MSSRRKSFIPCMVTTSKCWTTLKDADQSSFYTLNRHDAPTSEEPFNNLYRCTVCSFTANNSESLSYHKKAQHPDENIKRNKQTILENKCVLQEPVSDLTPMSRSEAEDNRNISEKEPEVNSQLESDIRAAIIPEPVCHVTPLLQRPPNLNTTPRVAVPLYTNMYNSDLDNNSTLISSFNRFPYPTHAELSWLTAASKHPEEQIRVWFTTQRLKQGITWSPEEVEESRKKMFNGSIRSARHTSARGVCDPVKSRQSNSHVTVTSGRPTLRRSSQTPLLTSEIKRQMGERVHESLCMMPPPPAPASPVFPESTKSSSDFSLASHLKIPVDSEEKTPVSHPAEFAKQRLPLTPIVSTNLKRSAVLQPMSKCNDVSLSMTPRVIYSSSFTCSSSQKTDQNMSGSERSVSAQFPLLERVKGKSPGQMKLLEESFQRNGFPSFHEVDHLMITTSLSREEIESWFLERRALRDDLEQALLNSMGSKKESTSLLKNVFIQTRWPVESQKGSAHKDFVRWFRDRRLPHSSGFLEQEEMFEKPNGCRTTDVSKGKLLAENTKPNCPEIEECFARTASQRWPDVNVSEGPFVNVCGGWKSRTHELISDTD